jgi:hypothetical protein
MGYTPNQNAFHAFETTDDSSVDTTVTKIAATANTTGSTLGQMFQSSVVPAELAAMKRTIANNQQALYQHVAPLTQQMAALSYQNTQRQPAYQAAPPIQQLHVPAIRTYAGARVAQPGGYQQTTGHSGMVAQSGGFQQGRGYGRSTGRGRYRRRPTRGQGRTAFVDYVPTGRGNPGGYISTGGTNAHRPFQSNLMKIHNNWNVCYSCGVDVEEGHDSMTCHKDWRKPGHDIHFSLHECTIEIGCGMQCLQLWHAQVDLAGTSLMVRGREC